MSHAVLALMWRRRHHADYAMGGSRAMHRLALAGCLSGADGATTPGAEHWCGGGDSSGRDVLVALFGIRRPARRSRTCLACGMGILDLSGDRHVCAADYSVDGSTSAETEDASLSWPAYPRTIKAPDVVGDPACTSPSLLVVIGPRPPDARDGVSSDQEQRERAHELTLMIIVSRPAPCSSTLSFRVRDMAVQEPSTGLRAVHTTSKPWPGDLPPKNWSGWLLRAGRPCHNAGSAIDTGCLSAGGGNSKGAGGASDCHARCTGR